MPDLHYRLGNGYIKASKVVGYSESQHKSADVAYYKSKAIKAAKDLLYGEEVINRIENAKCDEEITRIMKTERERRLDA